MTGAVVQCLNSYDLLQASKAKCTNHIADFVNALAGLFYALACNVLTNLIHERGESHPREVWKRTEAKPKKYPNVMDMHLIAQTLVW